MVALALNRALVACADGMHWAKATLDDWITTAALSRGAAAKQNSRDLRLALLRAGERARRGVQ